MKTFRADLHIHSVLSPCGDLEMSPRNIVQSARNKGIDIIAVTDHNHTGHCILVESLARKVGMQVIYGTELTTKEEVHCLAYFNDKNTLHSFQSWIDQHFVKIPHNPDKFGYQVIVDEDNLILQEIDYYLGSIIDKTIEQVASRVYELGGLFVPAHVDRSKNSIFSQLGFIPDGLPYHALELSWRTSVPAFLEKHPELNKDTFITNSDSHFPENIGRVVTQFSMAEACFEEIKLALAGLHGRNVSIL